MKVMTPLEMLQQKGLLPSTNPNSSPQPTGTAEKLYLQIRICAEASSGAKHVKREYRIELPANVAGLDEEAEYTVISARNRLHLDIPVKLQEPSSGLPGGVTLAEQLSRAF